MKKLRYCLASSLDGFIAAPGAECDWIEMDPNADFNAFFEQFDSVLMGRVTYEIAKRGPGAALPGMKTYVCSRSLDPDSDPDVAIVSDAAGEVGELKRGDGKDIWLFGGGSLFRSLLDAQLVDTIELSIAPIMLSQGVPLLPQGSRSPKLELADSKSTSTGAIAATYNVIYQA